MFIPLAVRSEILERTLKSLQDDMEKRLEGDLLGVISPTSVPRQEPVTVVGRICCEASDGRMNKMSIMLEGSRKDSGGHRIHLDLRDMNPPSFSLFPGQASLPLSLDHCKAFFVYDVFKSHKLLLPSSLKYFFCLLWIIILGGCLSRSKCKWSLYGCE